MVVGYRSNGLYILNLEESNEVVELQKSEDSKYKRVWNISWPNEDSIVITSTYGQIKLFKHRKENLYEILKLEAHSHSVFAIEALNGEYLATGDWSGELVIWKFVDDEYKLVQKISFSDTIQDIYWKDENNISVLDDQGKIYLLERTNNEGVLWNIVLEVDIASSKGTCISMTHDDNIFAATLNELIQFNITTQLLETININNIRKLFIDDKFVYYLTDNGLYKFIWKQIEVREEVISYRYVKAGLLGHTRSGKSTFCMWVKGFDTENIKSTYGRSVYDWDVSNDNSGNKRIILHDHGGQDTVIETFIPFLKDSDILLLFYVQKDRTSLIKVLSMLDRIINELSRDIQVYLVRTFIDDEYNDITNMEIDNILSSTIIKSDIHISPVKNIGLEDVYSTIVDSIDWNQSRIVIRSPINEGVSNTIRILEHENIAFITFDDFKDKYKEVTGTNISEGHLKFILNDFVNKGRIEYYDYISDKIIFYEEYFNILKSEVPKIIAYKNGVIDYAELVEQFGESDWLQILDEWYANTGLSIRFGQKRIFTYKLQDESISLDGYKDKLIGIEPYQKIFNIQDVKLTQLLNILSEMRLQCIDLKLKEGLFEWEDNAFIYYTYNISGSSVEGRYLNIIYYIGGNNVKMKNRLRIRFEEILSILYGDVVDSPIEVNKKKGKKIEYKYDVSLSFAGEQRGYVEQVAIFLEEKGYDIFYDEFDKHSFWGKDMEKFFINIFKIISEYCIMFISNEYMEKYWPSLERRSALERALSEKTEYVLPVKFDDFDIPELKGIGYLNGARHTPQYIADCFVKKWEEENKEDE